MITNTLEEALARFHSFEDEVWGIASGDLSDALPFFEKRVEEAQLSAFETDNWQLRSEPRLLYDDYRSAVVLFKRYTVFPLSADQNKGQIASFAVGLDYHAVLKNRLMLMSEHLSRCLPDFDARICIDTTPLLDRHMAYRTGKVFYGKNQQAIYPPWGAAFTIGYLLTNQGVKSTDSFMESGCGSCEQCIQACPTGALTKGQFFPNRCVSYLTQKKESLTPDEEDAFTHYIYGCDLCIIACPYTTVSQATDATNQVNLDTICQMSHKAIGRFFHTSGITWRGPGIVKRNACLVSAHKKADKS